jgi:hypothetical protein
VQDEQDMCLICIEPFKNGEVVIEYRKWNAASDETFLAHLDCALSLSRGENRRHPPLNT